MRLKSPQNGNFDRQVNPEFSIGVELAVFPSSESKQCKANRQQPGRRKRKRMDAPITKPGNYPATRNYVDISTIFVLKTVFQMFSIGMMFIRRLAVLNYQARTIKKSERSEVINRPPQAGRSELANGGQVLLLFLGRTLNFKVIHSPSRCYICVKQVLRVSKHYLTH